MKYMLKLTKSSSISIKSKLIDLGKLITWSSHPLELLEDWVVIGDYFTVIEHKIVGLSAIMRYIDDFC